MFTLSRRFIGNIATDVSRECCGAQKEGVWQKIYLIGLADATRSAYFINYYRLNSYFESNTKIVLSVGFYLIK